MSGGQSRTFLLQAVAVAVAIGIVYFAFLRPSDPDELAGIQAPGGDAPTFALPDERGPDGKRTHAKDRPEKGERPARARSTVLARSVLGAGRGTAAPAAGGGPADDQYTATATALMDRVRDTAGETALRRR